MLRWSELVLLSNEQLAAIDIAEQHLACAHGIPGSDAIDPAACIRKLDELVPWVQRFTAGCAAKCRQEFNDTDAQARMRCLLEVLWRGAGIRYDVSAIPEDAPWKFEHSFIHGALFGAGGTCATLPILYAALGRRLGYPLKLVEGWGPKWTHLFCRWEEPSGERFNVDVTAEGVSFLPDEYYRSLHPQSAEHERLGQYLQSKPPREELAGFLFQRGLAWHHFGHLHDAVAAYAWSCGLAPNNYCYLNTLKGHYNEWCVQVQRSQPPGFPRVFLNVKNRRFPGSLPLEVEQKILCLEMIEHLLGDHEANTRWWGPLRRGEYWIQTPRVVRLDSIGTSIGCTFEFAA